MVELMTTRSSEKRLERAQHYTALPRAHGKGGVAFAPLSSLNPRQRVEWALRHSAARNGSPTDFWFSTRWMCDYVCHDYARHVRALIAEGKLEQLSEYVYREQCRHYRFTDPAAAATSDTTFYLTGRTPLERWEELQRERQRSRTNLDQLTRERWQRFASPGDGRFYTDLASLPKEERARLTIDGQPTEEFDIPACFPQLIPEALRQAKIKLPGLESELAAYEAEGAVQVREAIIQELGGTEEAKANVKVAYSRIQCSPRTIRYPRTYRAGYFDWETDTVIQPSNNLTRDGLQQKLAVQALRKRFPTIVKALRQLALRGAENPFFPFSQVEARIRQTVKERAFVKFGYVPESIHDGFIVKRRHKDAIAALVHEVLREVLAGEAAQAPQLPEPRHTLESLRAEHQHDLERRASRRSRPRSKQPAHSLYSYGHWDLGPLFKWQC